jgi:GT2 family glycosyltransferase
MIVSTGLNAAIRAAHGEIVIRMDAHTEYGSDYVARCIATLLASGADNVGGPWVARGRGYLQSAIALGFQSRFASGGAGSHRAEYEGEVDSVYLGCWRRETLLQAGLFDEELVRNQDDELNLRLLRRGGRIWQSPEIRSWYYPRSSLRALFAQYAQYGYWKVRVIQKHHVPASARHLVPGAFVASLLALTLAAPLTMVAQGLLAALLGLYVLANVSATLVTCRRPNNWKYVPVMPFGFAAFHFGYGWGFLRGAIDFLLLRTTGRVAYGQLTR